MNIDTADTAAPRSVDPALAARLAEVREQKARKQRLNDRIRKERRVLIPCLTLAALAHFCLGTARVDGHSMEPTLHTGDRLYVWKGCQYFNKIEPGDMVLVHMRHGAIKGEEIVKRVVFVQNATGDAKWPEVVVTPHGLVSTRDFFLPYVKGEEEVPPNAIMVLGDNYENSMDSRDFGPVHADEIDGKVLNP